LEEQQRITVQLEERASRYEAETAAASRTSASLEALQERVVKAETAEATAQGHLQKLQADCAAKAQQISNLEVAMGELTYEAERAQRLELSMCQAQVSTCRTKVCLSSALSCCSS
jgi:chromosome segregation ATPase